jgi:hypothetical protein
MESELRVGAFTKMSLVIANPVTMLFFSLTVCANALSLSRHDFWGYASETWSVNLIMGFVALLNLNTSLVAYRKTWAALQRRESRGKTGRVKFRVRQWLKALKMPCSVVGALVAMRDFKRERTLEVRNANAETGQGQDPRHHSSRRL